VPELGGATQPSNIAVPQGSLGPTIGGTGLFVSNGSNTSGSEADGSVATFLFSNTTDSFAVYQNIVNTVERLRGQSIRWSVIVDPSLA
jgi:hypothetical protein